jgi:hypothetical protein
MDPKSVKGAGREAILLHTNLRKAYASGKQAFTDAFPDKLVARLADPRQKTAAVQKLFPDKGIDNIKNMRGVMTKTLRGTTNPEGVKSWNRMQRMWLEDLVNRSTNTQGQIVSVALENNIQKFGPRAIKELLGPEQAQSLRRLRGMAKGATHKPANLMFMVRTLQVGGGLAAIGASPGDEPTSVRLIGGTIALTPVIYAALASSRIGSSLLRGALTLPKGSKRLPGMVIKLNAALLRERKRLLEEPKKKAPIEGLRQKAIGLGARDE